MSDVILLVVGLALMIPAAFWFGIGIGRERERDSVRPYRLDYNTIRRLEIELGYRPREYVTEDGRRFHKDANGNPVWIES